MTKALRFTKKGEGTVGRRLGCTGLGGLAARDYVTSQQKAKRVKEAEEGFQLEGFECAKCQGIPTICAHCPKNPFLRKE